MVAVAMTEAIPQARMILFMLVRLHDAVGHSRNILGIFEFWDDTSVIDSRAVLAVSVCTYE